MEFVNTYAKHSFVFVDGIAGDPVEGGSVAFDGVFHDVVNASSRKIELLNASNSLVTSASNATKFKVTHWSGLVEEFGLIDLDPSTSTEVWAGRLTKRVDTVGRELNVVYTTWTPMQLAESPSRQWQIDTISDSYGKSLAFTYDTVQHGGRWCVTQVSRNDGASVSFDYSSDALASIDYTNGSSTTFTYGQSSDNDTSAVTKVDAKDSKRSAVFHLANDYSIGISNPPTLAFRVPGQLLEKRTLNGESLMKISLPADPSADSILVIKEGAAKVVYGDGSEQNVISFTASEPNIASNVRPI